MKFFFDRKMKILLTALGAATALLLLLPSARPALDTRLYYSGAEARAFLEGLLPLDVFNYFRVEMLDLFLYIPLYTLVLGVSLKRLYPEKKYYWASLLPAACDVYETVNILLFLSLEKPVPELLGAFTFVKWTSAFLLTALIFYSLLRRFKKT